MTTTAWSRREMADMRQSLLAELGRLESVGTASEIDAAVERTLYRRSRALMALARWDCGTYGRCCRCDLAIERVLLQQDPAAPLCRDCQAAVDPWRRAA